MAAEVTLEATDAWSAVPRPCRPATSRPDRRCNSCPSKAPAARRLSCRRWRLRSLPGNRIRSRNRSRNRNRKRSPRARTLAPAKASRTRVDRWRFNAMLMPKKVKYRKQQRGRMAGKAWRGSSLAFGDYGLKAMECGWVTDRQIEAARIAMTRFIKRGGKVWIRLFPDKPITKKPAETRMGKGKGAPEQWVAVIRPGKILFEMEGVSADVATEAMRLAAQKLPLPCKVVSRDQLGA